MATEAEIGLYKLDTEITGDGSVLHKPNLHLGRKSPEAWVVEKLIGEGGFGSVWLQKETRTGGLRAVKRIFLERSRNFPYSRELRALIKVRKYRRLFVEFIGWYESTEFVYVAMEYLRNGDLEKYLKEFWLTARSEAKEITIQLLEGLVVLHENNICHRDLKPNNILIACCSPIRVKLADFGTSKSTVNTSLRTKCGTSGYMAPEVLGVVASRGRYTNALDIWSLGCIIYEILTSELPFTRKTEGQDSRPSSTESVISANGAPDIDISTLVEYCNGRIGLLVDALSMSGVNDNAINFLRGLLAAQPASRTSATAALRSASGWVFGMPEELDHENGPDFLKEQFHSLGLELGFEAVEHLIMQCKACVDVDITKLGIRHVSDELIIEAIRREYNLIFQLLLPSSGGNKIVYLTEAVLCRNTKVVAALVRGVDINAMGHHGPLLPLGVRFGDFEVVELLLAWGANVNAVWPDSETALSCAVELGFLEKAKLLLDWGAGVDFAPPGRETALALAIRLRNLDMVTLLLDQEAKIGSSEIFSKPLLNSAVTSGSLEIASLLLDRGADVNNASHHLGTALNLAVRLKNRDMVTLLLDRGADINYDVPFLSSEGLEPAFILAVRLGYLDMFTLLLDRGADVNAISHYSGTTALVLAVDLGNRDMVTLLLDLGARVNARSRYPGTTALGLAVNLGDCDMATLLLDRGAGVKAVSHYPGTTALGLAVNLGNRDMATLLLDRGAGVNAVSHYSGTTALGLAVQSRNHDMATLLLDWGADINFIPSTSRNSESALVLAMRLEDPDMVTLLQARRRPMKRGFRWIDLTDDR